MIELNNKSSKNKKKINKEKINIKDPFEDLKDLQGSLNMTKNLSSSLSDIDKLTKKANKFRNGFIKFLYIIAFIIVLYVIYKIYISFIKKKKITSSSFDVENDIKKILDSFN